MATVREKKESVFPQLACVHGVLEWFLKCVVTRAFLKEQGCKVSL
jgi:hypothetical protein